MFLKDSYDKLSLYTFGRLDIQVEFPRGVWVYIATWHTNNGYALQVQDEFGTVYCDGSVTKSYVA